MFEREILEKLNQLEKEVNYLKRLDVGGGVTDHGELTGLGDDDHTQYVETTGDETIAGVKTFGSIPVLPGSDPTSDNQAVRKAYVDNSVNGIVGFVLLATPINIFSGETTSSTINATKLDLSTYGLPDGIKAVWVRITAKDTNSDASTYSNFSLSPDGSEWMVVARTGGRFDNSYVEDNGICTCDANGDVYYQVQPSGTTTYYMKVLGYLN